MPGRKALGMMTASSVLVFALNAAIAATAPAAPNDNAFADKDGRVRVQIAARNEVVLSSEVSARIASLPLREGDTFRAGQTLVAFDCALYQAQLNKAQASLEVARQTSSVSKRLAALNSIGALDVEQAEGKVKETAAEVAYMQTSVGKCTIAAPYAGRVAKRLVAAYQYVTPGTPLLGILETGTLELQMIVPSRWLAWLKPGLHFSVQVDESGKTVTGQVARIGARIDPVSQSVAVIGVIDGKHEQLLPGMSGWATFPNAK